MWATLLKILGPTLVSWLAQWFGQRQRDKLIVEAESAQRAEAALKAAREANEREADIRRLDDAALDERLRKFSKPNP